VRPDNETSDTRFWYDRHDQRHTFSLSPAAWPLFCVREISDVKPLKGMPLSYLSLTALGASGLSLVAGVNFLQELLQNSMLVADMTPLFDLCLKDLSVRATGPPI
jgi:hypothetical protein